ASAQRFVAIHTAVYNVFNVSDTWSAALRFAASVLKLIRPGTTRPLRRDRSGPQRSSPQICFGRRELTCQSLRDGFGPRNLVRDLRIHSGVCHYTPVWASTAPPRP